MYSAQTIFKNNQSNRVNKQRANMPKAVWLASDHDSVNPILPTNYSYQRMISRRDKLINYPFQLQRYEQHQQKVRAAKPAVDVRCPPTYPHVITKPKKIQGEKERLRRIETENIRLLHKLGDIMQRKRLKNFWLEPRPNFLNREKLFETRPHSSLPNLVTIYTPSCSENKPKSAPALLKLPQGKTAHRCPTCSGHPERTKVRIPEQRIPWQQSHKSSSIRIDEINIYKKCLHCGHPKK